MREDKWLEIKTIATVGDAIEALKKFPSNAPIMLVGSGIQRIGFICLSQVECLGTSGKQRGDVVEIVPELFGTYVSNDGAAWNVVTG